MNKREIAGYTRVQKRTAEKLYKEGETIYARLRPKAVIRPIT